MTPPDSTLPPEGGVLLENPILRGFNPDPSICRSGDDYFIATSTFEWFPGVQVHRSRDLVHWQLAGRPLDRPSLLDLKGVPDSCGVWAPCLTVDAGRFYLVYTVTRSYQDEFKVCHNYLTTADDIQGPWSEPVYLNASGFDPSLFHDTDGRKYLVNALWDHRPEPSLNQQRQAKSFAGIVMQEYSATERRLVGPIQNIFRGTELGLVEGPHLYRRGDHYYLLTAEGGTFAHHAALFARSRSLTGPYEMDPAGHLLTSDGTPDAALRRAGHADLLIQDDSADYLVHLAGRPLPHRGRCVLGRETAIQPIAWTDDGWPRLAHGGKAPRVVVPVVARPGVVSGDATDPLSPDLVEEHLTFDDPNAAPLPPSFQTLRVPLNPALVNVRERPGFLRLRGNEGPTSVFEQTLVARRQSAFRYHATTCVEFFPDSFQQLAGLLAFYNTSKFIYLNITFDPDLGRVLEVMSASPHSPMSYPLGRRLPLPADGPVDLRMSVDHDRWTGAYRTDLDGPWTSLGATLDHSVLSDEVGAEHFTGAFIALACHDMSGRRLPADFASFSYVER